MKHVLAILLMALSLGCSRYLDLEGRRCGCGPGYQCCLSTNRCIALSKACPVDTESGVDASAPDTISPNATDAADAREASVEAPPLEAGVEAAFEVGVDTPHACPEGTIECHATCQPIGGICLVDILDVLPGNTCSLDDFRFCSALPDRPDCNAILRKVRVASNDLDEIHPACEPHFPRLMAEVCALGPYQGYRVGLTMHVYTAAGAYADSRTARVEWCP